MIPFGQVLEDGDRRHIRAILGGPGGAGEKSKAARFLGESTFVDEEAARDFRALPGPERERLISELVWRITCHVDGSITAVAGVGAFDLAAGFRAVQSERDGREVFCLVR